TVCVVGKMRDLILQLSKSSIYSTKPRQTEKKRKNSRVRSAGDALTSTPAQSAEGMAVPFTTFAKTSGLTL
ncbi:hypothetical protein ACJWSE_27285, partial [Klebsiella pneumoniae]